MSENEVQSPTACSLPSDESTHPYNRYVAVAYAHRWATAQRPYNPKYYDFTDFGGDCTNFVNQAIHESSNAEMVFGGAHGFGQLGWYFYRDNDYANAWTQVQALFDFITQFWVWPRPGIDDPEGPGGPEGCVMDFYQVYEGDLIQYDWTNNGSWDHSAIIVRSLDLGLNNRFHWVAGHTPDVDDYPYTSFAYPNKIYRFIHIERIDGYAKSYLPLILNFLNGSQFVPPNPYPGPMDSGGSGQTQDNTAPYPAP